MSGAPTTTQVEPNASQSWSGEQRIGAVRWTGFLAAPESGEYRFRYAADGGYRVWVNGTLVVDAWHVDWRPSLASGAVTLEAGHVYPIRVEKTRIAFGSIEYAGRASTQTTV